jgi:hypothetical protein
VTLYAADWNKKMIMLEEFLGTFNEVGLSYLKLKPKYNKRIHTPNIHVLSGIRTHNHNFQASEDISRLTPRGYCDRHLIAIMLQKQLSEYEEYRNSRI